MKILFITPSLEPGKDGVGDYAKRLAGECVRSGHSCCLLALNDRYLTDGEQDGKEPGIPIFRQPAAHPWEMRLVRAREIFNSFRPGWISLQFVSYGYSERGIVYAFSKGLKGILPSRGKRHVMFHETWIGASRDAPLKDRVIGLVQKRSLKKLLAENRPDLSHTSNKTYRRALETIGLRPKVLPLFGNIPFSRKADRAWFFGRCGLSESKRENCWIFVLFGILHPEWRGSPFFDTVLKAAKEKGKEIAAVLCGRSIHHKNWEAFKTQYDGKIRFVELGELPERAVSEVFQGSDFGISTSPWQLASKSSATASMLDHGLPVFVTRNDYGSRYGDAETGTREGQLILYRPEEEERIIETMSLLQRFPIRKSLEAVARQFLYDLEAADEPGG